MKTGELMPLVVQQHADAVNIRNAANNKLVLSQNARSSMRPYIHPIVAPDGKGVLTEDSPGHHPWQHGLYTGMHKVNGADFWIEQWGAPEIRGLFETALEGDVSVDDNTAHWRVQSRWLHPDGTHLLTQAEQWSLQAFSSHYLLDVIMQFQAATDVTFGRHDYGGLFLRMPYRKDNGGQAVNAEGWINGEAEQQRSAWVAVHMPVDGREDGATIVMMDHASNPEHPQPWRVDGQLGIAPSRCIAGDWKLAQGESTKQRYRLLIHGGPFNAHETAAAYSSYKSLLPQRRRGAEG